MQMHLLQHRIQHLISILSERTVMRRANVENLEWTPRDEENWQPFANGGEWGVTHEWVNFRCKATVPASFTGRTTLRLRTGREAEWEAVNPQFLVVVDGRIEQAFDTKHTFVVLSDVPQHGKTYEIFLEAYTPFSKPEQLPPRFDICLADEDEETIGLMYDLEMPLEAANLLPEGDRDREKTLHALSAACDLLDLRAWPSAEYDAGVRAAREYLQKEYYEPRRDMEPIAYGDSVGHTHIDVAWQWDLYQSRHKAARSFATVLKLMERYPEYKFMSSQPVLYEFVKEDHPDLYERIKEAVARGQLEPEGGMWVEADCNLSSGESLVRQFLHGQEYFTKEFGKPSRILWLPDVFGYSAALPQICKLSGIDYFMTSKLSWSEYNLYPYDTFMWKGIDGTEMLTHFTPTRELVDGNHGSLQNFTTYNSMIKPSQFQGGWKRFQQKALDNRFLVSYGYGDGGGGPTEWMLENGRRMEIPLPGTPVFRQEFSRDFFEKLEQRVAGDPKLPKWSGELYLEYHRGTYTAIAKNKRNNRKIELAIRDAELLCSMAYIEKGLPYPAEALHDIWHDTLTLQFHDILPGSSIEKVYDDSDKMYAAMFAKLDELKKRAMDALAENAKGDILFYNTLGFEREDVVWFDAPENVQALRDANGDTYPVQRVPGLHDGKTRCCAYVAGLKPMGATPFWFVESDEEWDWVDADVTGFDTPFFTGAFDDSMRIVSLVEKISGRQLVREGESLNRLVVYENRPHQHDAWDINIYYACKHWDVENLVRCEVVSQGPVCAVIRCAYSYGKSTIEQDIIVYQDLERIDFDTKVDWHEDHGLLKAHFPVDIFQNEATYDVQFGNVKRPTHRNTSWDIARFEVCAHKWADVSEDAFGFALLNDCKYGHSADENGLALTLLKSSTFPNPNADIGNHRFTYSIMPHDGGWRESNVPEMAYRLNVPVIAGAAQGGTAQSAAFACCDSANVVIETVKQQMDGDGIVLRVYECFGRRVSGVRVRLGYAPEQAEIANLLEQPIEEAQLSGHELVFDMKPYEIKTFLLR